MNFEKLDQRTIQWNQIANGHRTLEQRINTKLDQCHEEMMDEFFMWLGEWNKFYSQYENIVIAVQI